MKRISQVLLKVIIIMLLIQLTTTPVSNAGFWEDIFTAGDQFLKDGQEAGGDEIIVGGNIKEEFNRIYNILFTLGVVLTVIIGAVLGVKFIVGSVEEQAKVKEMLLPYIAGSIVIFGAFGIWKLLVTLLSHI